ncbi:hypothetical protein J437_LFUL006426 [Ladona fulva]|uniref:Zinc finger protein 106 n=1 Tax=Ladona fulva TaxID=123851 RepID=A0A8K0K3T0_LADFU|nr:hypothetical protein J437_LFUL006426 [Ladona fulva]
MEHFFDKFDPRGRGRGDNWKLGLRFPPPGNVFPPRNPMARNNDYGRLPRDEEHNFSSPGKRTLLDFPSNFIQRSDDFRDSPSTSRSNVSSESNVMQTASGTAEDKPEKITPQLNPESAKKEALAAELRKSLQKFQKTHSQSGSKLLMFDKSNESSKAESTCEPQTCFPWDLPLTVDDLKSIGRGKTGNIEASADSCSENELNLLEKQNAFHPTDRTGESTNETSPEIQVIKQVRKRKVSDSIDIEKKKKPKCFQSRRRHRSASPTLCEEVEAENEGKSKEDEKIPTASEKESDSCRTASLKIDASRKSRHKPSLIELLGVRRREFSEMVDQPRNPKVQFMLNLLMKRHKELLSQRALRSRFSTVNGKVKVGSNQRKKESHTELTETPNTADSALGSRGASDAIDELTNILLESSLTVDISSLPQELIEQLGNFLEMGVDLSSLGDEIAIVGELAHDSAREIEEIQQQANESLNLMSLTPEEDTVPRVSESSESHQPKDIPDQNKKENISSVKVQKSTPERASPHPKRRAKVTEETLHRKEKEVPSNSCNLVPEDKNPINQCDQQLDNSKDSSSHSKGLVGDDREISSTQRIKTGSVTIPSECETRSTICEESRGKNESASVKSCKKEVLKPSLMSAPTERSVSQISPVNPSNHALPADPKDEEETEEKLLSKMWDIDMEIGKLMEKKQQLYLKLTQLRNLRQNSQCIVSTSKGNRKSIKKTITKQSESVITELNRLVIVDRVSGENSEENHTIPQPSFSDNHSSSSQIDCSKIPPATCDGAESVNKVKLIVQTSGSKRKLNDSVERDKTLNEAESHKVQNIVEITGHSSHQNKDTRKELRTNTEPYIITKGAMCLAKHKETVLAIKVHKKFLYAACADFTVYCFNLLTSKIEMQYCGHTNTVTSLHISVDNHKLSRLFSGSHDQTLRMFSARTGVVLQSYSVGEKITCMEECWGILYIGTKEGNILRFNLLRLTFMEQKLPGLKTEVMAIQASKEGPRKVLIVALRDKPIIVRDASTGLLLRSVNESTEKHIVYAIHAVHGLVYAGSSLYGLTAWDFTNGKRVHQYEGCGSIVAVHVVNRKIYAASYDGNVYIYDCRDSKPEYIIKASNKMLLCLEVKHNKTANFENYYSPLRKEEEVPDIP